MKLCPHPLPRAELNGPGISALKATETSENNIQNRTTHPMVLRMQIYKNYRNSSWKITFMSLPSNSLMTGVMSVSPM